MWVFSLHLENLCTDFTSTSLSINAWLASEWIKLHLNISSNRCQSRNGSHLHASDEQFEPFGSFIRAWRHEHQQIEFRDTTVWFHLGDGDKLRPCIWITSSALQLLRKKTISLTAFSRPCCLCWNLIKCYKWALI